MLNEPHWKWQHKSFASQIGGEINIEASEEFWKYDKTRSHFYGDKINNFTEFFDTFIGFDVECRRFWVIKT